MDFRKYFGEKLVSMLVVLAIVVLWLQYGDKAREMIDYIISLLYPFLLAICMAFIMNVPMRYIETRFFTNDKTGKKRPGARGVSILLTLLLFLGILVVVMVMILPELAKTTNSLIVSFTTFSVKIQVWIKEMGHAYPQLGGWLETVDVNWIKLSQEAIGFLRSGVGGVLNSTVTVVGSIVIGIFHFTIALALAIYILYSKEELAMQGKKVCYSFLKPETAEKIVTILRLTDDVFSDFLSGQCVEACILGFMFFLTLSLFDLPYALLIGVMIAVTAMIPIFGAMIGCFFGAFLIGVVNPIEALLFLVLFVILQQIEENLIYPHIVGSSIGLPSLWVLTACTLGGSVMGIMGMLLFIPIASIIYKLFGDWVEVRLRTREIPSKKWEE